MAQKAYQTKIDPDLLKRSNDAHRFIRAFRDNGDDTVVFLLVPEYNRAGKNNYQVLPRAIGAHRRVNDLEPLVTEMTALTKNNDLVHLQSKNAKGYAVHMVINKGGRANSSIRQICAQFIDVDLNKMIWDFKTEVQAKKKAEELRSHPEQEFATIAIQKKPSGRFRLVATRTEQKIAQLKKEFLRKYRNEIKEAIIVETYNGFHLYWLIRDGDVGKFSDIQLKLSKKFSSDPKIINLARVMRLPGFYHMKNPKKPYLVRVIHWGKGRRFTQEELIKKLNL